jgi:hypothetical protein
MQKNWLRSADSKSSGGYMSDGIPAASSLLGLIWTSEPFLEKSDRESSRQPRPTEKGGKSAKAGCKDNELRASQSTS